jgi:hypothetical protein
VVLELVALEIVVLEVVVPISIGVCNDEVVDNLGNVAYIGEAKREINYFN